MTTICSQELKREALLEVLQRLEMVLEVLRADAVDVTIGWGSDLPIDDLWKTVSLSRSVVPDYVLQAERDGKVRLGEADITVEVPASRFRVLFCHHRDIHCSGSAADVQTFMALVAGLGLEFWQTDGAKARETGLPMET